MRRLAPALIALAVVSCNDDTLGTGIDMTVVPVDMSPALDLTVRTPDGIKCGTNMTCNSPQVCCVTVAGQNVTSMCGTPASCPGMALACDGPEDCGTSDCCATVTIALGGDGGMMATPQGAHAACTVDCPPAFNGDLMSGGDLTTKLCHTPNDCVGYQGTLAGFPLMFTGCCSSPQAPNLSFCAPKLQQTMMFYTCQ